MKMFSMLLMVMVASAACTSTSPVQAIGSTTSGDFVQEAGVCKPRDGGARAAVVALQVQLNRVASSAGLAKVEATGAVDHETLRLFANVQALPSAGELLGDPSSCMGVAPDVDVLADDVRQLADRLSARS